MLNHFDTHVCLISKEATPNLTPILDEQFRPKKVLMMVSAEMRDAATRLAAICKRYQVQVEQIAVENVFDLQALENQFIDLLANHESENMALNVTGGTKPMAIAASLVFKGEKPIFYVHPQKNSVFMLGSNNEPPIELANKLKLSDYLPAHGFKIIDSPAPGKASAGEASLTETLVGYAGNFHSAIARLNWLAQQASSKKVLELADTTLQKSDPDFDRIMDYVREAGLATISKDKICFRDEAARAYLNGGWLEQYVFGIANGLKKQDIACNLTVESQAPGHSRNELDVAILAQNRLHVIECKTSRMDQSGRADGVLYKLDTLTAFGGLNTKGMLVSFQPLKAPDLDRAKDLRVKVVDADKLRNLKQIMNEWINSQ